MFDWIRVSPWAYPALEVVHLLGVAALIGNLLLFELRVWGAATALPLRPLARWALSLCVAGFGVAAASGSLMFATQWDELLSNRAFVAKLLLLAVLGLNALAFHARGSLERLDGWARAQTALSLGLWVAVLACGRFIAYV